ncbi:hypothetical protein N431DRAFT_442779 [Stipitochalara longipes BDJ]|nr:hypothetical protein N431DRAFT_442779 [Stipitochalara longipes BDJ]
MGQIRFASLPASPRIGALGCLSREPGAYPGLSLACLGPVCHCWFWPSAASSAPLRLRSLHFSASSSGRELVLSWKCWRALDTRPALGYFANDGGKEGIQMYLRRDGGTLAVAAASIQVPLCIFWSVWGCGSWLLATSSAGLENKIAFWFEHLGLVALFLGRLGESWTVEMGIRICLSSRLPHSIITLLLKTSIPNVFVTVTSSPSALRLYQSVLNSVDPAQSIRGTAQGYSRAVVSFPVEHPIKTFDGLCHFMSLFSTVPFIKPFPKGR